MKTRSRARGWALRVLYGWDARGGERDLRDTFTTYAAERGIRPENRVYVDRLIRTIAQHHDDIDRALQEALTNWRLARLSVIDRNILRIGGAELLFHADVPPRVAIQEAILLAEKYGTAESPRFVNGVLDALMRRSGANGRDVAAREDR
jgi:N utilization substance protein B